jgi:hypothetical protein
MKRSVQEGAGLALTIGLLIGLAVSAGAAPPVIIPVANLQILPTSVPNARVNFVSVPPGSVFGTEVFLSATVLGTVVPPTGTLTFTPELGGFQASHPITVSTSSCQAMFFGQATCKAVAVVSALQLGCFLHGVKVAYNGNLFDKPSFLTVKASDPSYITSYCNNVVGGDSSGQSASS